MYGMYHYGSMYYGDIKDIDVEDLDYKSPQLMKYLPYYYQQSNFTKSLQNSFAKEIGLLNYFKQDLFNQFFISTATWGLKYYEKELGLDYNPQLTDEERREIIRAKIRGRGTTTVKMIKNTAESFSGGEVEIIENNTDYSFTVKFVGVKGVPSNMKGFLNMLETIKPAHLNYNIEYTYLTWRDIKQHTWGNINNYTWKDVMDSNELLGRDN